MATSENIQRQIETRELTAPNIDILRSRALKGLEILQEEAVRAQLYPSVAEEKNQAEPTIVEKAAANLVWARKTIPVTSDVLLRTGRKIEFTQGVFTNSAINCMPVGFGEKKHLALTIGITEIAPGEELVALESAWNQDSRGIRRNIERLAGFTPLDVIGKAYSSVTRI